MSDHAGRVENREESDAEVYPVPQGNIGSKQLQIQEKKGKFDRKHGW